MPKDEVLPPGWEKQFKRTPEQEARDRAELERLVELEKEKPDAPMRTFGAPRQEDTRPLTEVLSGVQGRLEAWDSERRGLVCVQAMWPNGVPSGYLSAQPGFSKLNIGAQVCRAAGARPSCAYAHMADFCPFERVAARRGEILQNMSMAGVEKHEYELIRDSIDDPAKSLKPYDSLRVVKQFLAGVTASIPLDDGAGVDVVSGELEGGRARFAPTDRLLVMGGNNGRGKTVAACYAIGRLGGLYIPESLLSRKGPKAPDVDELKGVPGALVIDHVGLAEMDEARTPVLRMIEIVDRRAAAGLWTILLGNFEFAPFAARYRRVLLERISGFGLMVLLGGASLRASLREAG